MEANQELAKFPYLKTSLLSAGIFASNIAWSVFIIYIPLFVRRNLYNLFPDSSMVNTIVGLIMILDNLAALFIQPYIGRLSDKIWVKKLGRRLPFILLGIPLAAFSLGLIGTFENMFILLLISITSFNISMAIFKTPVLSLIPDFLPKSYRSQGSGMMSVVGGIANILGLFLSAYLYQINHALAFWVIGGIMILCLVILSLNVHEKPDQFQITKKTKAPPEKVLKKIWKENNSALIFALLAVFFNSCGYQAAETFLSSYTVEILQFSDTQANYVLGTFAIFGILAAFPAGLLGKKLGARDAALLGSIFFSLATIPLALFSITSPLTMRKIFNLNNFQISPITFLIILLIIVIGFSWALLSINLIVIIWNMASKRKIATYTGYFHLFSSTAAILSPFLAGLIFDLLGLLLPFAGLRLLFLFVGIAYSGVIFCLGRVYRIQENKLKQLTKDQRKRYRARMKIRQTLLLPFVLFGFGARKNKVKTLRKRLKNDRKEFTQNIKEWVKEGDLPRKDYREIKKMLRDEHKQEIKELKQEIKDEKQTENNAK